MQQAKHSQQFLQHIHSIDPLIQFTAEFSKDNGSTPFADTIVSQESSNFLTTSVYRKAKQTDQYLHWDSHHGLFAKYSVFNTLAQRARVLCTIQQLFKEEWDYIKRALLRYSYLTLALNRPQTNINHRLTVTQALNNPRRRQTNNNNYNNSKSIHIFFPFTKGLNKGFKSVCDKWEYKCILRGDTIRNLMVAPKDKDNITNKSEIIYRFKCTQAGWEEEDIGEL